MKFSRFQYILAKRFIYLMIDFGTLIYEEMKNPFYLFVLTVVFISNSMIAQNLPSEDDVVKATKKVIAFKFNQNELQDFVRYDQEPIVFIQGNFSGLNRTECLAVCPMMRQTGTAGAYQKFIMLFYKNADGTWSKGTFAVLAQSVDTMDLNNDNIPELICKSGYVWNGEGGDKTTIYETKGDAEKIIYSNESIVRTFMLKVGDEAEKIYEISFTDSNNDGIMEIEEKLAIGIVESMSNDEPTLYYKKSTRILTFTNGKYN